MELKHLKFFYDDAQDRLLLRIAASEKECRHELRAWLSRRFVANLWSTMQKALEMQVTLIRPDATHASAELIDMAHQNALQTLESLGAFGTDFENDLPPHADLAMPFLVREAKLHIAPDGPMRINFLPQEGVGIEIAFDQTELHGFCTLMQQAVSAAGWDQPLQLASAWDGLGESTGDTNFDRPVTRVQRLLN